jgi:hypothetical protein
MYCVTPRDAGPRGRKQGTKYSSMSVFFSHEAPQLKNFGAFCTVGGIYGTLLLWLDREELGALWMKMNGKLCEIDGDEVTRKWRYVGVVDWASAGICGVMKQPSYDGTTRCFDE